jgi:hypothetical protein
LIKAALIDSNDRKIIVLDDDFEKGNEDARIVYWAAYLG